MRAAANGGRFWDHEPPTVDELNNDKYAEEEYDRNNDHRRSDSQAELKMNAARAASRVGDNKDTVNISMNDIYPRDPRDQFHRDREPRVRDEDGRGNR